MSGDDFAQFIAYGGSVEKRDKERKRKRDRYAEDPAYRMRKIEEAKRRYAERTAQTPKKRGKRGRNKPRPWVMPDGRIITLISVGAAADLCKLSKRTLINYETGGIIPTNRLIDQRGRRWYPKQFAEWLSELLSSQSEKREPLRTLKRRVERAWQQAQATMPVLKEQPDDDEDCGRDG
jgi:hypothetical protein